MKTSAVLASLLFGSFAVAAPVDRRALVYKTEVVTETVVVYTTVYDDEPVAEATTTSDGAFYEQPKPTSSAVVVPTSSPAPAPAPTTSAAPSSPAAPAYTPSTPAQEPSSVYTPPPPPPAPETPTPTPEPQPEAPKPTTTPEAPAPAPAPTSVAPAAYSPAPAPASSGSGGAEFSNVDMTIYDNNGGYGACGTELHDTDMIVALAQPAWGASTYDTMTGAATNPWCGQKIKIEYEGNSIEAKIMDMCPGCSGHDIDLSLAAWKKLTGLDEKTRLKASWSKMD